MFCDIARTGLETKPRNIICTETYFPNANELCHNLRNFHPDYQITRCLGSSYSSLALSRNLPIAIIGK